MTATLAKHRWRSTEAEGIVGVSYRQIDHWVRLGLVAPIEPGDGSGSHREFSRDDLRGLTVVAAFMGVLRDSSLCPPWPQVLAHVRQGGEWWWDVIQRRTGWTPAAVVIDVDHWVNRLDERLGER